MGRDLADAFPAARHVYQKRRRAVAEAVDADVGGAGRGADPHCQPPAALMAQSLAGVRALESRAASKLADASRVLAGHSLGEYAR